MRFWFAIDRDNVWQRRLIAIGAGLGGGLIYLLGTMILTLMQQQNEPPASSRDGVRMEVHLRQGEEKK